MSGRPQYWRAPAVDRIGDTVWAGIPLYSNSTSYPTEKNERLLLQVLELASEPGDLVLDCFMGSGTTQAVAMKLGRRFIGADINLGAVQITSRRLIEVAKELEGLQHDAAKAQPALFLTNESDETEEPPTEPTVFYTGFEVYNVNFYDNLQPGRGVRLVVGGPGSAKTTSRQSL